MDRPVSVLGARIKAIRKKQGMTLSDLSAASGVSVSTLSKIENGRINASVDTMFKIARGLGVLFDNLLVSRSREHDGTARRVITPRAEAQCFPTEFYDYFVHSTDLVRKSMLPLVMCIKTRQAPDFLDWSTHAGEEFVLVLEGAIELHTDHYAPMRLEVGDSAYFDSLMRHAFVSVGEGDAKILSISVAHDHTYAESWHPNQSRSGANAAQDPDKPFAGGRSWRLRQPRNESDTEGKGRTT